MNCAVVNISDPTDQFLNIKRFATEYELFCGWIVESHNVGVFYCISTNSTARANHIVHNILVWTRFCPIINSLVVVFEMVSKPTAPKYVVTIDS